MDRRISTETKSSYKTTELIAYVVAGPDGGLVERTFAPSGQLLTVARAVGQGCGANPLPILIPCHRVLAAAGLLTTGFFRGEPHGVEQPPGQQRLVPDRPRPPGQQRELGMKGMPPAMTRRRSTSCSRAERLDSAHQRLDTQHGGQAEEIAAPVELAGGRQVSLAARFQRLQQPR